MSEEQFCDSKHSHAALVETVGSMPDDESLNELAQLFKLFGDPTRIKILCALYHGELCVCDLAAMLNMTQSAISHQLRFLKDGRAVRVRREGRQMIYSLHDNHVIRIFGQGLVHIMEHDEAE